MSSPLEDALRADRDGAAVRRRLRELPEESWLRFFPTVSEAYCFCLLRIDDNEGEKSAQKMAKALGERHQSAQLAWEQIREAWDCFSPYEVTYTHKYTSPGLSQPEGAKGRWSSVQAAARDFEEFKDADIPLCHEQFEVMSRAADFISGLAKSLK